MVEYSLNLLMVDNIEERWEHVQGTNTRSNFVCISFKLFIYGGVSSFNIYHI